MFFLKEKGKRFTIGMILLVFVSLVLIGCESNKLSEDFELNVMSYNMRFENINNPDPIHPWSIRKHGVVKSFDDYDANIIGTQELEGWQYDELMELLGEKWSGFGKPRFLDNDERVSILYRNDIYDLLEEDTFWISETPDAVGSKSWGTAHPRIFTYGKFQHKFTKQIFYVYNTHLDHKSKEARKKGLELVMEYIGEHLEYPTIITGDFNMFINDKDFGPLTNRDDLSDSFSPFGDKFKDNNLTSHGFNGGKEGKAIDFIFYTTEHLELLETEIIYDRYENRYYLSDHYPVLSKFALKDQTKESE